MKECNEFEAFEENFKKHYYENAIGWIVGLHKVLLQSKEKIQIIKLERNFEECGLKYATPLDGLLHCFFLEQVSFQHNFYA